MGIHILVWILPRLLSGPSPQDVRINDILEAVRWPARIPNSTELIFENDLVKLTRQEMPKDGHQPWLQSPEAVATVDCAGIVKGVEYGEDDWSAMRNAGVGGGEAIVLERSLGERHLYALVFSNRHSRCFTLRALVTDRAAIEPVSEEFEKTIELAGGGTLCVSMTKDFVGTVELRLDAEYFHQSVTLGDVTIRDDLIEHVDLDGKGEREYFITFYNPGSCWDYRTCLIAWNGGKTGWKLILLPFESAEVKDTDGDGIYEVVASGKTYSFRNGLLVARGK